MDIYIIVLMLCKLLIYLFNASTNRKISRPHLRIFLCQKNWQDLEEAYPESIPTYKNGWMDGMARLGDGCRQVSRTACYQDNVLFIVMLQVSAATALSPSD